MERLIFGVADAKFEGGVFSGRVHAYGEVTVDSRRHSFQPGIFQKSIEGGAIRAYWGHQPSVLRLGSQKAGSLHLTDTGSAVDFAVKPPDTGYVRDLKAVVDAGEEVGVSFEFEPAKFEKRGDVKVWTEGRLRQINFVDDPAFEGTSVILNSVQSALPPRLRIRVRLEKSKGAV